MHAEHAMERGAVRQSYSSICLLLLMAAIAFPYRFDFALGTFTTISLLDIALVLASFYLGIRFLMFNPVYTGPPILLVSVLLPVFIGAMSLSWATNLILSTASAIKYVYTALCYLVALQLGRNWSFLTLSRIVMLILLCWLAGSIAMYLAIPGFEYFVASSSQLTQSESFDLLASIHTRLGHPYLGQSNDYGPLLAFVGFVLLGHARLHGGVMVGIFSGLAFVACFFTFSRGVIGGAVLGLIIYAALSRISIKSVILFIGVISIVVGIAWFSTRNLLFELEDRHFEITTLVESRLSAENIDARLEGYREAVEQIGERPFIGHGVGFFNPRSITSRAAAHNSYLEQMKYFGVILGTVTFACYFAVMVYFFGLRRRAPHLAAWGNAIGCGWLSLLVSSSVETFLEASVPRAVIYLILGLCVAVTAHNSLWRPRNAS